MTDRGVSVLVSYIAALGVTTLLVTSLVLGMGGFLQAEREAATRAELRVVGNQLAADLAAVDRLSRQRLANGTVRLRTDVPERAAGVRYEIELEAVAGAPHASVHLRSLEGETAVTVTARMNTTVAPMNVDGGDLVIRCDADADRVVVRNG